MKFMNKGYWFAIFFAVLIPLSGYWEFAALFTVLAALSTRWGADIYSKKNKNKFPQETNTATSVNQQGGIIAAKIDKIEIKNTEINKPLPEIKFGTLTDVQNTEGPPYKYSFVLRYSTTLETPAGYRVEYIKLELHNVITGTGVDIAGDETDTEIFLSSLNIEGSFDSCGMERIAPDRTIGFSSKKRIENLKLKLIMGVEGGLTKEDSRTIWKFDPE